MQRDAIKHDNIRNTLPLILILILILTGAALENSRLIADLNQLRSNLIKGFWNTNWQTGNKYMDRSAAFGSFIIDTILNLPYVGFNGCKPPSKAKRKDRT